MKRIALLILYALILVFTITSCTTREKIFPNQLYETFQSGDFTANNWVRGGALLPVMQSETVQKGQYAVEFPRVGYQQTSFMYIDLDIEEDMVISFFVKTNFPSINSGGRMSFFIDDQRVGDWNGMNDWKQVIRELPAGKHRLTWEFSMNSITQSEEKCAWLDNIMISEFIPLGEPIVFTDDVFKTDVLDLIGKGSTKSDSRYSCDVVYVNEVKDVERVAVSRDVTDISGVEHFISLKKFYCYAPGVTDISPLSNLQHLEAVNLWWLSIADISPLNASGQNGCLRHLSLKDLPLIQSDLEPMKSWEKIERLTLTEIPLDSLDFLPSGSNLWILDLNNTGLTDINALANKTNLVNLFLNDNDIQDIRSLSNLTKLKGLFLAGNQITDITPLENLLDLEQLNISDNVIEDISPLSTLKKLGILHIEYNNIKTLAPLASLEQLKYFHANHTGLEDITAIRNMKHLEDLYLDSNAITDITPIVEGPLESLDTLLIQDNYLDLTEGSKDMENIQILKDAGVWIWYEPQKE